MSTEEILSDLKREAFSVDLIKASTEKLNGYAAALCHPQAFSVFGAHDFPQVCETVRIHLLRAHIETLQSHVVELHDHITRLNAKNSITQYCVIALTVVAVIAAVIQTTVAIRAEQRPQGQAASVATQPQQIQLPASVPIPAKPPSSHPASLPVAGAKTAKEKPGS